MVLKLLSEGREEERGGMLTLIIASLSFYRQRASFREINCAPQ